MVLDNKNTAVLTWDHVAMVWGTYLLRHFLTPCGSFDVLVAQVVNFLAFFLNIGGVADSLKPSSAHFPGLLVSGQPVSALPNQRIVTGPHCVVERNLLKTNLASLPVYGVIALFLLHGFELCHIGVMASRDVLMPALLDGLFFHLLDIPHLGDAHRSIYS